MDPHAVNLLLAAASVALIHTVAGPDHWLPFAVLARSRGWSLRRTLAVTLACGLGHVGSSIALGWAGVALGWTLARVAGVEAIRGDLAAWALLVFGTAYLIFGIRRGFRSRRGLELHDHDGHVHIHVHGTTRHAHGSEEEWGSTTFWSLFIVFVLGPCEPMIPLFMMPLSRGEHGLAWATAIVFTVVTIASMLGLVAAARYGVDRIRSAGLERWSHAMAGGVIAACGAGILFLGF